MSEKIFYMKWYVEQWMSSVTVRMMTPTTRCIYHDLLNIQWLNGGSFEKNPEALSRMIGCTIQEFEAAWNVVCPKYFHEISPGVFSNGKSLELLHKAQEVSETKARAGSQGGIAHAKAYAKAHARNMLKQNPSTVAIALDVHDQGSSEGVQGEGSDIEAVRQVFAHWMSTIKPVKASLTPPRIQTIREAFNRGHSAEECCQAITEMSKDEHAQSGYNELRHALAVISKVDKVEFWINKANIKPVARREDGKRAPLSDALAGFPRIPKIPRSEA